MVDVDIYNEDGYSKRKELGVSLIFTFANNSMVHIRMLKSSYQEKIIQNLKGSRMKKICEHLDDTELESFKTTDVFGSYYGYLGKLIFRLCERHIILQIPGEKKSKKLPLHVTIEPVT